MTERDKELPKRFRIYYCDREPYSGSTDHDAFYAPQIAVQAVAQEDKAAVRGFRVVISKNFFYWNGGMWWPCDQSGYDDYMFTHRGPKAVLFTRTMPRSEDFWGIVRQAREQGLG